MSVLSISETHMTETRPEVTSTSTPKKIRQRHERRHIELPGGKMLIPRAEFAAILGENERTTRRRNLPTVRIAGVSYVERARSLEIVAAGVKRPNQTEPPIPKPRPHTRARPAPSRRTARTARR
jgi:hypothetical protein